MEGLTADVRVRERDASARTETARDAPPRAARRGATAIGERETEAKANIVNRVEKRHVRARFARVVRVRRTTGGTRVVL
jgi:hypothetical protein